MLTHLIFCRLIYSFSPTVVEWLLDVHALCEPASGGVAAAGEGESSTAFADGGVGGDTSGGASAAALVPGIQTRGRACAVDDSDLAGRTPLHLAAAGGHVDVLRVLLQRCDTPAMRRSLLAHRAPFGVRLRESRKLRPDGTGAFVVDGKAKGAGKAKLHDQERAATSTHCMCLDPLLTAAANARADAVLLLALAGADACAAVPISQGGMTALHLCASAAPCPTAKSAELISPSISLTRSEVWKASFDAAAETRASAASAECSDADGTTPYSPRGGVEGVNTRAAEGGVHPGIQHHQFYAQDTIDADCDGAVDMPPQWVEVSNCIAKLIELGCDATAVDRWGRVPSQWLPAPEGSTLHRGLHDGRCGVVGPRPALDAFLALLGHGLRTHRLVEQVVNAAGTHAGSRGAARSGAPLGAAPRRPLKKARDPDGGPTVEDVDEEEEREGAEAAALAAAAARNGGATPRAAPRDAYSPFTESRTKPLRGPILALLLQALHRFVHYITEVKPYWTRKYPSMAQQTGGMGGGQSSAGNSYPSGEERALDLHSPLDGAGAGGYGSGAPNGEGGDALGYGRQGAFDRLSAALSVAPGGAYGRSAEYNDAPPEAVRAATAAGTYIAGTGSSAGYAGSSSVGASPIIPVTIGLCPGSGGGSDIEADGHYGRGLGYDRPLVPHPLCWLSDAEQLEQVLKVTLALTRGDAIERDALSEAAVVALLGPRSPFALHYSLILSLDISYALLDPEMARTISLGMAQGVGGGSADDVAQGVLSMFERVHAVVVNIRRSVAAAYASITSRAAKPASSSLSSAAGGGADGSAAPASASASATAESANASGATGASALQGMQARLRLLSRGGKLDECDGWSLGAVPSMLEAIVMHLFIDPAEHHVVLSGPLDQRSGSRLGACVVGPSPAALYAYESRMRYFARGALHPNEPLPRMPRGYALPSGWAAARRPAPPTSILPPSLTSASVVSSNGAGGASAHTMVPPGSSLASLTLAHAMSSQTELEAESRRMQRALDLLWHLTPSADNSRFDALELSEFLEADMAWGAAATPSLAWRFVSMDRGACSLFFASFFVLFFFVVPQRVRSALRACWPARRRSLAPYLFPYLPQHTRARANSRLHPRHAHQRTRTLLTYRAGSVGQAHWSERLGRKWRGGTRGEWRRVGAAWIPSDANHA